MSKLRVMYSKSKESIYLSHYDIMKVFEKSLSRSNIAVKYYGEDIKKLNIIFAHPLSIGIESVGEIFEVELYETVEPSYFVRELNKVLPSGITILTAEQISSDEKVITSRVYASVYIIEIIYTKEMLFSKTNKEIELMKDYYMTKMKEFLEQDSILVTKKSKERIEKIDIKAQIRKFRFLLDGSLEINIDTGSKSNLKTDYILSGFNEYIDEELEYNVKRTRIIY